MDDLAGRTRDLSMLFTSWPSVTGSDGERLFASRLFDHVRTTGFSENQIHGVETESGTCGISLIFKRGRSPRTIVLTGHFDTVATDDYGDLEGLALDPARLVPALVKQLRQRGLSPLAIADLESGAFLPGRGLLDMKAGLAAGLAVVEHYRGDASLILLSVCDEENRSAGARGAIPVLRQFAREQKLEIALVINLDSISDQGDGGSGRVVTYGSIGKQLLCAHVEGKPIHAGYSQLGVNAAYVMAELVRQVEGNPRLADVTGDEAAAPPTVLFAKDGKSGYNVTTPASAFAYWNTLQHRQSGAEVLDVAMQLAKQAATEAEARTGQTIAVHAAAEFTMPPFTPDPVLPLPDQTRLAFAEMVRAKGVQGPAVILGFGSIPYPAVLLKDGPLRRAISDAVKRFGLGEVNYFAGISDMSFFGEASGDLSAVSANTPLWGRSFTMPEPGGWPCINIGPWGRDYHTWLERLHAPYAFETLPRVLLSVIDAVAKLG